MRLHIFSLCLFACTACAFDTDDFLDRLDNTLTVSAFHDNFRARLSGTLDLEFYNFQQPAPGLIDSNIDNLFNPRLTLFLDAQLGSQIYFFSQVRLDRGFDPTDFGADIRLDEYALRVTPWQDGRFTLQVGQFATVVGNWVPRHLSWENPFINAPLVYENVTAIQDKYAPFSPLNFIYAPYYYGKYTFNPVIWGPDYATGISASGRLGEFDYAVEMKNASLSSRPESWYITENGFDNPTFSGRVGFRPNEAWNLGFSASEGPYFRREAETTLPPGMTLATIENLFLDRTPVSPGIICKSGPRFTKPALKCHASEMRTHWLITSKRNTSLRRSFLAPFAGTSNSSTKLIMATAVKSAGVQTSKESTSLSHIASQRTRS